MSRSRARHTGRSGTRRVARDTPSLAPRIILILAVTMAIGAFPPGSTSIDLRTMQKRTPRALPAYRASPRGWRKVSHCSRAKHLRVAIVRIVITDDPMHERVKHLGAIGNRVGEDARRSRYRCWHRWRRRRSGALPCAASRSTVRACASRATLASPWQSPSICRNVGRHDLSHLDPGRGVDLPRRAAGRRRRDAGGGMKKRIGIVEDTGDNRRIIRDLLTSSDSQPQTLRQARSKNQPPSCFVRCVGISAIRLWRRTGPATAAVMVALSDRPGM